MGGDTGSSPHHRNRHQEVGRHAAERLQALVHDSGPINIGADVPCLAFLVANAELPAEAEMQPDCHVPSRTRYTAITIPRIARMTETATASVAVRGV